ncbi:hypothetical protein QBC43DRAFT_306603, partial [Cladorrhinum sp. PSN259]
MPVAYCFWGRLFRSLSKYYRGFCASCMHGKCGGEVASRSHLTSSEDVSNYDGWTDKTTRRGGSIMCSTRSWFTKRFLWLLRDIHDDVWDDYYGFSLFFFPFFSFHFLFFSLLCHHCIFSFFYFPPFLPFPPFSILSCITHAGVGDLPVPCLTLYTGCVQHTRCICMHAACQIWQHAGRMADSLCLQVIGMSVVAQLVCVL